MNRPSVRELLSGGVARLEGAGVPGAGRDARVLLGAALGLERGRLALVMGDPVEAAQAERFGAFVAARCEFRPVSQIVGRRLFWGHEFRVTGDVLDPRPETERLVELALGGPAPRRVLDLGTGSGAILLSLLHEWPEAEGLGVDMSPEALAVARGNAEGLGLEGRARFEISDWFEAVAGRFDLVVCNPPYIARGEIAGLARDVRDWEPHLALSPGETGLESYQAIAAGLAEYLAPAGRALFEIGAEQGADVSAIFRNAGFENLRVCQDLDGRDRVIALNLSD